MVMKNIHVLPTDKPSNLTIRLKTNELMYSYKEFVNQKCEGVSLNQNQHIYITSDEVIKQGDWCIYHSGEVIQYLVKLNTDNLKKIILTTDQELINDGVQRIRDEFLEWFIKNPSCERVKIKMENYYASGALQPNLWQYKIIIPQEEPKQIKCYCGHTITCDCSPLEEPKQETLEEASWKFNPLKKLDGEFLRAAFIKGAKWQSERMYDEAIEFAEWIRIKDFQTASKNNWIGLDMKYYTTQELFEQFKK
jgi:hypothetical protein